MFKNILIPTDGSPASRKAIAAGVQLASALGAKVTGLFAAPPPTPIVYKNYLPSRYLPPEEHAALIERASTKQLAVIEQASRKAGVPYKGVSVTSDFPAEAILATAKKHKCDLIFMASHGHRGLAGVILGSQTQKVLAHTTLPVLVYR